MNHRLQQFLSAENISQAQFADSIEVARASVSHVLAGRNKPGYDFIRSISDHYPKLNLEWLISGKGKMYKQDSPAVVPPQQQIQSEQPVASLFNDGAFEPEETGNDQVAHQEKAAEKPVLTTGQEKSLAPAARSITRIIVFYDDNTFQELK